MTKMLFSQYINQTLKEFLPNKRQQGESQDNKGLFIIDKFVSNTFDVKQNEKMEKDLILTRCCQWGM